MEKDISNTEVNTVEETPSEVEYLVRTNQLTTVNFVGIALVLLANSETTFKIKLISENEKEIDIKEGEYKFYHQDSTVDNLITYFSDTLLHSLNEEKFTTLKENLLTQLTVLIQDCNINTLTVNALTNVVNIARLSEQKCDLIKSTIKEDKDRLTMLGIELMDVTSFYFQYFDKSFAAIIDEYYKTTTNS